MMTMMNELNWMNLGRQNFYDTWQLQKQVFEKVGAGNAPGSIILVEHPSTFTFGKTSQKKHLLITAEQLQEKQIQVYDIDRGGDITFHGPGQLVCYPILNLNFFAKDLHWYLRSLEEVVILTLEKYKISAVRKQHPDPQKNYTGVWVNDEKICAIGVKVSHWITMHGLALNVSTDLKFFDFIVPCGIYDKKVTSMEKLLHFNVNIQEVSETFKSNFEHVFN